MTKLMANGGSWRRWFRRTNVYIAEYILMLILVGSMLGIMVSLWYGFFGLMAVDGSVGATMARATAMQLASLLVIAPAAYFMYARVTGQEMIQPDLYARRSRTVFLTIWIILTTLALVGVLVSILGALVTGIFGFASSAANVWLGMFLPGLFAVATFSFGLMMVVKHVSRKFVLMVASTVVAALALVLIIGNITMVAIRKDGTDPRPTRTTCTISAYARGDCTYRQYLEERSSSDTSSGSSFGTGSSSNSSLNRFRSLLND